MNRVTGGLWGRSVPGLSGRVRDAVQRAIGHNFDLVDGAVDASSVPAGSRLWPRR
jgi:hypothetical protein